MRRCFDEGAGVEGDELAENGLDRSADESGPFTPTARLHDRAEGQHAEDN